MKTLCMITAAGLCLIAANMMAAVSPDGGASGHWFGTGQDITITWNDDLEADIVDVALWNGTEGSLTVLAAGLPAGVHRYVWHVPAGLPTGERYRFVVRDALNHGRFDMSGGWISINMPRPIISTVNMLDDGHDVVVTPMPASDNVTVVWGERSVSGIEVVDLHHRRIMMKEIDRGLRFAKIDLTGLSSGMVFVRLHDDRGASVTKPLIIER